MTPRTHPHRSPDDILVGTLTALTASAPLDTSLTIATDDGDVVYGYQAWTPRTVRGLVPVVLALAHSRAATERQTATCAPAAVSALREAHHSTPDAIDAALWELGMERSYALGSTQRVAATNESVDLDAVAIVTTASDVLLLAQQVVAGVGAGAGVDAETRNRRDAGHLRCLLHRVPAVSMVDAGHGSAVCVVHLATASSAGATGRSDVASLGAAQVWHSGVLSAVCSWLTASEHACTPQPPTVSSGDGEALS